MERDDGEELRALGRGSVDALQALLDRYWAALWRYAVRIVNDPAVADDIVHQTFVTLWERRRTWRVEGSARALLFRMVRNTALNELKRRARQVDITAGPDRPDDRASPEGELLASELGRAAASAVAALPPRRRAIFLLARERGLSHREIAVVLGIAPQTVANHLTTALADLRRALTPFLVDDELAQSSVRRSGGRG